MDGVKAAEIRPNVQRTGAAEKGAEEQQEEISSSSQGPPWRGGHQSEGQTPQASPAD